MLRKPVHFIKKNKNVTTDFKWAKNCEIISLTLIEIIQKEEAFKNHKGRGEDR
jgi:hypothetical protein